MVRLLTNSRTQAFMECSQRHYYRYELGYQPVKKARALEFGTAVHHALEAYWKARQVRANNPLGVALNMLANDTMDDFDRAKSRIMVMAYAVVWDSLRCKVLGVEVPFELPLRNPDTKEQSDYWWRAGKIDLILELPDKRIALVEHKTSSEDPSPGGTYASRLTLDEQVSYYSIAARSLNIKPDVIIYDVLRKPQIERLTATESPKLKKDGTPYKNTRTHDETPDEYEQRVFEKVQQNVAKYIARLPVHRFDSELLRFEREVWSKASVMKFTIENNAHTRNSHACARHYGSVCPYLDVCRGMAQIDNKALFEKLDDVHPELEKPEKRTPNDRV